MGANNLVGWVVPGNYSTSTYGAVPAGVLQNSGDLPISSHVPLSNFAPRVGFAEQLTSKLVLRGGFGLFYDRVDVGALVHGLEQGPPYSGTADVGSGNRADPGEPFSGHSHRSLSAALFQSRLFKCGAHGGRSHPLQLAHV